MIWKECLIGSVEDDTDTWGREAYKDVLEYLHRKYKYIREKN